MLRGHGIAEGGAGGFGETQVVHRRAGRSLGGGLDRSRGPCMAEMAAVACANISSHATPPAQVHDRCKSLIIGLAPPMFARLPPWARAHGRIAGEWDARNENEDTKRIFPRGRLSSFFPRFSLFFRLFSPLYLYFCQRPRPSDTDENRRNSGLAARVQLSLGRSPHFGRLHIAPQNVWLIVRFLLFFFFFYPKTGTAFNSGAHFLFRIDLRLSYRLVETSSKRSDRTVPNTD